MNELTNAERGGLSVVENLARQARHYAEQTSFNMLQLGRVLTEAKEVVPHGEFTAWVQENAGLDQRAAQYFMECYKTYGLDPEMAKLSISKLRSLLPMSDEKRQKFLQENNVAEMSVREINEKVRKARAEEQEKAREAVAAEKENALRMADSAARRAEEETRKKFEEEIETLRAERADLRLKAKELEKRAELAEGQVKDATEAAITAGKDVSARSAELENERREILRKLEMKDRALDELQAQYDELDEKYHKEMSTIARGDAERSTADILSANSFHASVRDFLDQNSRFAYMRGAYDDMNKTDRDGILADLLELRDWTEKALEAMGFICGSGATVE